MLAVDDDGRHGMDADLLPEPLGLAHLVRRTRRARALRARARPAARPPRRARRARRRSRCCGRRRDTPSAARVSTRAARRPAPPLRPRTAGDARRRCSRRASACRSGSLPPRRARRCARDSRRAARGSARTSRSSTRAASAPSGPIVGFSSNGCRCTSISPTSAPMRVKRALESAHADRAPRARDVRYEIDSHGHLHLARSDGLDANCATRCPRQRSCSALTKASMSPASL